MNQYIFYLHCLYELPVVLSLCSHVLLCLVNDPDIICEIWVFQDFGVHCISVNGILQSISRRSSKNVQKPAYHTVVCALNKLRKISFLSYSVEAFQALNKLLSGPTLHRYNVFSVFIKCWYWFECPKTLYMVDGPNTILCSFYCFCILSLTWPFQNYISIDCLRFPRNTLEKSIYNALIISRNKLLPSCI